MSYFVNMIYGIVSFTLTDNFLIRLSAKEILEVSYKKFDTLVSFDIYIWIIVLKIKFQIMIELYYNINYPMLSLFQRPTHSQFRPSTLFQWLFYIQRNIHKFFACATLEPKNKIDPAF
jgi:hypothetical protein